MMFIGQVSMSKVNWGANKDLEFVANYKVLQTAFTKLHVDRVRSFFLSKIRVTHFSFLQHIDVDRLIKGVINMHVSFSFTF